jgi:co-chaperonin GroES (HSP10)
MRHEIDPKQNIIENTGDLKDIEIFNNQVLVAIYKRPEMTNKGIIIPESNRNEDQFQSKVGLILKMGPTAFMPSSDTDQWFKNLHIELHEWVFFRPSDGWSLTLTNHVNPFSKDAGVSCRIIDDIHIRGRISAPDFVW